MTKLSSDDNLSFQTSAHANDKVLPLALKLLYEMIMTCLEFQDSCFSVVVDCPTDVVLHNNFRTKR